MTREEIIQTISTCLQKRDEVIFAYIFGSFTDQEIISRDIDIGIFIRNFSSNKAIELEIELSEEIGKMIKRIYPVDVIVINNLNPLFVRKVITGKLLFTKDENLWIDFVVNISMRADDIAPLFYHSFKEAYLDED
ncbi:MAG: nucleotidyltransferase domain-containing protein [Thermodesulfovibrionales bacterium]|nr:nucleotidyltransferase domain-containing protein [Thermodesulfovibrionales bacterium]